MSPSTRVALESQHSLRTSNRGIALILVVLLTSFLSALGLGVALAVFLDRLASGNLRGSIAMLYAADSGIELTARDLAQQDWNLALAGDVQGSLVDGPPGGVRAIPGGGAIDLTAITNTLNCGKATACTASQMNASTKERPWGVNNPRWRLFLYGPLNEFAPAFRPAPCYLAVWIADDAREEDGDPLADGEDAESGRGILRVRAEAWGATGSRRAIEAELARICPPSLGGCLPGIRVQSWQELRQAIP
jgi:hypothetical protein